MSATIKGIEKAVLLENPREIAYEVAVRKKVMSQMAGTLYAVTIDDEIGQLVQRYESLGGNKLSDDVHDMEVWVNMEPGQVLRTSDGDDVTVRDVGRWFAHCLYPDSPSGIAIPSPLNKRSK